MRTPIRHIDTAALRRSGNAAKVIVLSLAGIFLLLVLACGALGVAGYFWIQRNFAQAFVTDPAVIRQITAEMVDMDIPPEFEPFHATKIFGVSSVSYQWCPQHDCRPAPGFNAEDGGEWTEPAGLLTLNTFTQEGDDGNADELLDQSFLVSDKSLKQTYSEYTKEELKREIRGREYSFWIVTGRERDYGNEDFGEDGDEDMTVEEDVADEAELPIEIIEPADATAPVNTQPLKPEIVVVSGQFPGKGATASLQLRIPRENYDAAVIKNMLDSIR